VLEVGIVLQVPTPSALPHTWTLKWVYEELGSATPRLKKRIPSNLGSQFATLVANVITFISNLGLHKKPKMHKVDLEFFQP
jgi:hypothetical protein